MAPKSKKKELSTPIGKSKKSKDVVDDRFQAVVLTDSFETRFMPMTSTKPRCLLPLCNIPLIEYTLEFLATSGINEVFLLLTNHSDQIQQYIDQSKWSTKSSPLKISCIVSMESHSVGDSMRDLDNRGLITGDFLLISGDVVTNIDFSKILQFHNHKKSQDKDHMLTMVLNKASPLHKTRSYKDPACFVMDKQTNRCLYYQSIPSVDGKKSSVNIELELLEEVEDEFVIRNDLIDCQIDICSELVLSTFQDNFDYQSLRTDFVKGVLTSDLLKKTIYCYISNDSSEYASRVESWQTYDSISQDILSRWCYPLVPDMNLLENNQYQYEFNNIYKEDQVVLATTCKIETCVCIGRNTSIGEGTIIKNSIIGRNCKIGKNIIIKNSYIWDNTIIEDDSNLNNTTIGSECVIGKNVSLLPGSIIGFNVKIGANKTIPPNFKIFNTQKEDFEVDIELIGEDGEGMVYDSDKEIDDSESTTTATESNNGLYQLKSLNISDDSINSITNKKIKRRNHKQRRFSSNSMMSENLQFESELELDDEDFSKEGLATVLRAINNNHDIDTALLELNTLRMSMNVTYHDVRLVTVQALLHKIVEYITTDTLPAKEAANKIFSTWGKMFKRQVFSSDEQIDLLQILIKEISSLDHEYNQVLLFISVKILYDLDIIEEEQILKWWEQDVSNEQVKELLGKFVTWLQEADEEDSEEESEGDE